MVTKNVYVVRFIITTIIPVLLKKRVFRDLSNVTNQPQLTFPEFATAMYLTSMKMSGSEIPLSLPDSVRNEIRNAVFIIQGNQQPQQSLVPANIATQPTGYTQQPAMTGGLSSNMLQNNMAFANRMMPHTSYYTPPAGFESLSKNVKIPWAVTDEEKKQYTKIFKAWDTDKKGVLSGEKAKEIFTQSGLPQNVLMQIW